MMVRRVFVEKKPEYRQAEEALLKDIVSFLGVSRLTGLRMVKRYDVQGLDETMFLQAAQKVFSEPQVDLWSQQMPSISGAVVFAVEALPGQFDQRSDSAESCIQLMSQGERPVVKSALLYYLYGTLSEADVARIKAYVINPVDSREASMDLPTTLATEQNAVAAEPVLHGFVDSQDLDAERKRWSLAMDDADLSCVRDYFRSVRRDPTATEMRVIDTYWSDHCRHTTFSTHLDEVEIEDSQAKAAWEEYQTVRNELHRTSPVTLMDIATIGAKALKKRGLLTTLDESPEINACTVKVVVDGAPWLLLFKNETHNHPTEIEPFGGAATCIGGAIRDPLSGRAYVYQAMRISGCGDPREPVEATLPGRIPQHKLAVTAAQGYSSYGNQVGLATGLVDELYHPDYRAKHLELGAVIGAVPADHVVRVEPQAGDVVLLVGGRTGRDGCGGATGSSKRHDGSSLQQCGAEVQKGNAPEERKIQRLFRDPQVSRMIKRCNDFGAGGVSVAIGELADGLEIDLDKVPVKYQGLSGTELAISESQERMAVVVDAQNVHRFRALAARENLEATAVAVVTDSQRLVMHKGGQVIVDIARSFLDSHGAVKHAVVKIPMPNAMTSSVNSPSNQAVLQLLSRLDVCSKQGLSERFDSTIGAGTVLMPFGGRRQKTPAQVMCALLPTSGRTNACSVMAWGGDPALTKRNPFLGGRMAVIQSLSKLVAAGCDISGAWLSLQEFFGKPDAPEKWGAVTSALLGAFSAQLSFGVGAIGGKDSMSGTFGSMDVPPTVVSFAVAMHDARNVVLDHFQQAGHQIVLCEREDLPGMYREIHQLMEQGEVYSARALGSGGLAEALCVMAFGNAIGVEVTTEADLFPPRYGALVLELDASVDSVFPVIGTTTTAYRLTGWGIDLDLREAERAWEGALEPIYPRMADKGAEPVETITSPKRCVCTHAPEASVRPTVVIPVFPGTNCEMDLFKALSEAGFRPKVLVVRNLDKRAVEQSAQIFAKALADSQMLFIPGGFSGGDEPDGSGKFIASFLRNPEISEQVSRLLDQRGGLVGGICNGFQALVKLGLLPYGRICDVTEKSPTLTFNPIGRHQSMLVRTRVCSVLSPWLSEKRVGQVDLLPISHGEGRFVAPRSVLEELQKNGQIATQYVSEDGEATMHLPDNPNGSLWAIEGITSPDGRVFGRMAHSERYGTNLYRNTPYRPDDALFRGAYRYFR